MLREVTRLRSGLGPTRVLDIGCGDGVLFDALAAFGEVEGIEPDERLLSPTSRWAHRIHNIPFDERYRPDARYGLIVMLDVLEHMPEPQVALRHAVSLLEPGGALVLTVPAFRWLWTTHDELNHHHTRYSRGEIEALAAAAGAQVERSRYFFQWLVPAKLLVRGWERVRRPSPRPPGVPHRWLNEILYRWSNAEHRLGGVLRLPFGSSLLAVLQPSADSAHRHSGAADPHVRIF